MTRPDNTSADDTAEDAREESILGGRSAERSGNATRNLAGPGPHGDQDEDPDT
jgi:hypothetical protein